ncbi:hypothetical protein FSST1_010332 [Fusarium sambucinum]
MNKDKQAPPSGELIRRFSGDVSHSSPGEPLGRALATKVAFDRNREFLGPLRDEWDELLLDGQKLAHDLVPDEEVVLLDQSRRLHEAWSKFRRGLPKDQQMQLEGHDRPDINYLVATVAKASATWQSDREGSKLCKLKSKFQSLCQTCHDHSSLLSIIPKDDKYVTLLTGSLSAIAQATINHQQIAEGVSDTLDDLSHDIDFWNRQMREHGNIPSLRHYIQELYVVVFEFFTEIFNKWSKSSWKRFLTSFDDGSFNKLFTARKSRIMVIERRMDRDVNLNFRHRTKMYLERLAEGQERLQKSVPGQLLSLGEVLQQLIEQGQPFIEERLQPTSVTRLLDVTAEKTPSVSTDDEGRSPSPGLEVGKYQQAHYRYSRAEIQTEMKTVTRHWMNQVEDLVQATKQASLLQIDKDVHHQVTTWLRGLSSSNLWIQGPHDVSRPSQNTMTAASLAALARFHNIPCVIYFCTFTNHNALETSKKSDLYALIASIVTQLVQLIPDQGYSEVHLSPARFAALEQGALSMGETMQLIRDVRKLGPRLIHAFIDNLQVLEDRSDEDYTRDFLNIIATLCRLSHGSHNLGIDASLDTDEEALGTKICFTTEGYVDGLAQAVDLQLVDRVEFDLETSDPISGETSGGIEWDYQGCNDE